MRRPMTPSNIHPKVAAGALAGAAVTVAVSVAGAFGVNVPPDVAAALVTLLSFAAGYLKGAPAA
jgi:hypothetical protein